jgi:hypothetical protein
VWASYAPINRSNSAITSFHVIFIVVFNTPSACGGVMDLFILGSGLALGFNTFYLNGYISIAVCQSRYSNEFFLNESIEERSFLYHKQDNLKVA